ncbi:MULTISPECIES: RNA ligase [unclassified Archaeoglobus]|jgi:putative ATP-dependent DNA ligase|uniref:RNA ligase n=1 Tax=unclassified Archaeoglobus TaxID=2643606 RepID=UPI0025C6F8F4|nr:MULTISPECIES: RNA ligase [unclassified Archaeoglobus]
MNFVAKALNLSISAADRLEERNILRKAIVKHPFFPDIVEAFRLEKKFGFYEDGTVVVKAVDGVRVFRGFPKIRRILVLNPTLKKHFGNREIALEEKMNGYNVRVAKIGENLYGITRRGLICPYTTEKVRERFEEDFFKDYPDYMLCCEAVGLASPYVPSEVYGIEELDFFLFDIRNSRTNDPLSIREKEEIAESYGLNMAKVHLVTHPDDFDGIKKVIDELNSNRREGIVFKDVEMKVNPLKYTTTNANTSDLRYAFRFFGEYARDFMLARILREAFQSFEFKEGDEEFNNRCLRLGRAILEPMISSIKECSEGKTIYEESILVFSSQEVLDLFKSHLRLLGVDFKLEILDEDDRRIRVKFKRVMRSTNDRIKGILKGSTWK